MIRANGLIFVTLQQVARVLGSQNTVKQYFQEPLPVPTMKLFMEGNEYVETGAVYMTLKKRAPDKLPLWSNFATRRKIHRSLTKAEKVKVAAEQEWLCMRCSTMLKDDFEVDHVEEWSVRKDDSRHNLQALCPSCHRSKTKDDVYRTNPYFGNAAGKKLANDEQNREKIKRKEREEITMESEEQISSGSTYCKVGENVFSTYFFEPGNEI